ncbi:MAG: arginase, partial [Mesorhizobium sp.]
MRCRIVGAPVQDGAGRMGCEMGPSALRTAGLVSVLAELGHQVEDWGTVEKAEGRAVVHGNLALKALPEISAWTAAIAETAYAASRE